jgi:hypothetical protein
VARSFYFGAAARQGAEHLGVDISRPRPATQVVDALVVDGDDGDTVAGGALGAAHPEVVGHLFEAFHGIQSQQRGGCEYQADDQGDYPVGRQGSLSHRDPT